MSLSGLMAQSEGENEDYRRPGERLWEHKDVDTFPYRLHREGPNAQLLIIESLMDSLTSHPGKASGPIGEANLLRYLPSGPVNCEAGTASR